MIKSAFIGAFVLSLGCSYSATASVTMLTHHGQVVHLSKSSNDEAILISLLPIGTIPQKDNADLNSALYTAKVATSEFLKSLTISDEDYNRYARKTKEQFSDYILSKISGETREFWSDRVIGNFESWNDKVQKHPGGLFAAPGAVFSQMITEESIFLAVRDWSIQQLAKDARRKFTGSIKWEVTWNKCGSTGCTKVFSITIGRCKLDETHSIYSDGTQSTIKMGEYALQYWRDSIELERGRPADFGRKEAEELLTLYHALGYCN